MNNKIIVTGGTGMVGQSLQKIMPNATYLSSKDCNLKNLDEQETANTKFQNEQKS